MKTIALLGSSVPLPDTKDYQLAWEIGRLLAQKGHAVMSGGYLGTMEAVSAGAASVGGTVIGITQAQKEGVRPMTPNQYVTNEIPYLFLRERIDHLITKNDGIIVLPGGIGTLAEMATAWNSLLVQDIAPRPLILVGELWSALAEALIEHAYIMPAQKSVVCFAHTAEEAVSLVLGEEKNVALS